jgi:L-seryl-tRNA(Ser) seleniumtransferase
VIQGHSVIGGGSTPNQSLPTWLIRLNRANAHDIERRLRAHSTPIIARIENDRLILDLRTVFSSEESALAAALR